MQSRLCVGSLKILCCEGREPPGTSVSAGGPVNQGWVCPHGMHVQVLMGFLLFLAPLRLPFPVTFIYLQSRQCCTLCGLQFGM